MVGTAAGGHGRGSARRRRLAAGPERDALLVSQHAIKGHEAVDGLSDRRSFLRRYPRPERDETIVRFQQLALGVFQMAEPGEGSAEDAFAAS